MSRIGKVEIQGLLDLGLIGQSRAYHLVQYLLLGLSLLGVLGGTVSEARHVLLHGLDLILLPVVLLELILLLFGFGLIELIVVAVVVVELPPSGEVDGVVGDVVEKVLGVRDHEEDVVPLGEVVLEPDDGLHVQVVGRLVQQEQRGLYEQRPRQADPHPPPPRKVLGELPLHLVGESQSPQYLPRPLLGRVGVQQVEALVDVIENVHDFFLLLLRGHFVVVVVVSIAAIGAIASLFLLGQRGQGVIQLVRLGLQRPPLLVDGHDGVDGRHGIGRLDLLAQMKDIDVVGDGNRPRREASHEGRLATPVPSQQPVSIPVVQHYLRLVEHDHAPVLEGVIPHVDVAGAGVDALAGRGEGADGPLGREELGGGVGQAQVDVISRRGRAGLGEEFGRVDLVDLAVAVAVVPRPLVQTSVAPGAALLLLLLRGRLTGAARQRSHSRRGRSAASHGEGLSRT
mmetsp:Transcript_40674/g.122475  ORF Transcript_40674/g.122475 Transcript_40674/m.122475 type:complete len:455 (+) Transcript_40674:1032-2396(+)